MSIFLNLFRRNSVPASQNLLSNQRPDDESSQSESEFKIKFKVSNFEQKNPRKIHVNFEYLFIFKIFLRTNLSRNRNSNMENMLPKIKKRKMVFNWHGKYFFSLVRTIIDSDWAIIF